MEMHELVTELAGRIGDGCAVEVAGWRVYVSRLAPLNGAPALEPAARVESCDCGLFARCELHERTRPKGCKCNGPAYPSSLCSILQHRDRATAHPERDPARLE